MSWIIYTVSLPQTQLKNVPNLVKRNQWLHAYMLTQHLKQCSLAWRCQRSVIFVCLSRCPVENMEWFHTYRDEMQSGTAVLLLRGKSTRIVKLKWCGRNVWLVQTPTHPCFSVMWTANISPRRLSRPSATAAHHCPPTSHLSGLKSGEIIRKRLLRTTATLKTVIL